MACSLEPCPLVSVIVLTHNSFRDKGGSILHTLAALAHQDLAEMEVVVVDNGSRPADSTALTRAVDLGEGLPARLVCTTCDLSISGARNHGAALSRGRVLVFLDDDAMLVNPDTLSEVVRISTTASHGYGARRLWTDAMPWFQAHTHELLAQMRSGDMTLLAAHSGPPPFPIEESLRTYAVRSFPGHFGFVRRTLFGQISGFPEVFSGYGCEDDAFGLACYLADPAFGWLGKTCVVHVHHAKPSRYRNEQLANLQRYKLFLAQHRVSRFRIDRLLEGCSDDIIERSGSKQR